MERREKEKATTGREEEKKNKQEVLQAGVSVVEMGGERKKKNEIKRVRARDVARRLQQQKRKKKEQCQGKEKRETKTRQPRPVVREGEVLLVLAALLVYIQLKRG